jgi:hypothetical protein
VGPMSTIVQQRAATFGTQASEAQFPAFSGAPNRDPVGGSVSMHGPAVPPELAHAACYAWETTGYCICTQTWGLAPERAVVMSRGSSDVAGLIRDESSR